MSVVLVIEDVEDNYFLISKILNKFNTEVLWAQSGKEALKLFDENKDKLSLILLDLRLPDISGLEIIKTIRATGSEVPVIAQTAFAMSGDRQKAIDSGCNDYISKPLDIISFKQKLNLYLS